MIYDGYLIEIGDLKLPYIEDANVFENGSFQITKEPRLANEWTDIVGVIHHETTETERVVISFTIKDRDINLQKKITTLFAKNENIFVKYYDSFDDEYKEGYFFVETKEEIVGIASKDNVYYKPMNIVLKEY